MGSFVGQWGLWSRSGARHPARKRTVITCSHDQRCPTMETNSSSTLAWLILHDLGFVCGKPGCQRKDQRGRLSPNEGDGIGVVAGILLVSGPLLLVLMISAVRLWKQIHPLRWLGLFSMILVLFAGSLVVSAKI